jgi:cell division protein FtsL
MLGLIFSSIAGSVAGFFKNISTILMAGAVVISLIGGGIFYWKWSSAEVKVVELQGAVSKLQTQVAAEKLTNTNLNNAMQSLEDLNRILANSTSQEAAIDKDIDNAKPEDDGKIAPVLRRALDSVARMLNDSSKD